MEKIYRKRRFMVFGSLIVALILVGILIWALIRSVDSVSTALYNRIHQDELTAISKQKVPRNALNTGIEDCKNAQVNLVLDSDSTSVVSGGNISFTATLEHKGKISCLVDGSDSSRVLTITSGDQVVWSSALCKVGARSLLISNNDKDIKTLTWDTNASSTECGKTASPAKAGSYKAKLSMRDLEDVTSNEVSFTVTDPAPSAEENKTEGNDADQGAQNKQENDSTPAVDPHAPKKTPAAPSSPTAPPATH